MVTETLKDYLLDIEELTNLLEGGIYNLGSLSTPRITYTTIRELAYGSIDLDRLLPIAIIGDRYQFSLKSITDEAEKHLSSYTTVEIRLYQESKYDIISQAQGVIFKHLHAEWIDGNFFQFTGARHNRQAEELKGVSELVLDYRRTEILKPE